MLEVKGQGHYDRMSGMAVNCNMTVLVEAYNHDAIFVGSRYTRLETRNNPTQTGTSGDRKAVCQHNVNVVQIICILHIRMIKSPGYDCRQTAGSEVRDVRSVSELSIS
ncbi:hypothetical protein EYF80_019650 [Liparis tanakae]|uniref:Uncharacterized protein n=1 Tax=Liparis tanakae TaxID=230148 RepID=A0A4Z2HWD8_9TELE|nr:hypothetical protein EYF80_019650 [Liparis tanakae]